MIELIGKNTSAKIMIDDVESQSMAMVQNLLSHPACTNPVRIMPDVHLGKGIVIGFSMEMNDKIVPSWVGVDISCGILAVNIGNISNHTNIDFLDFDNYVRSVVPLNTHVHNSPIVNMEKDFNWDLINRTYIDFTNKYKEKFGIEINPVKYDYEWFKNKCKEINISQSRAECSVGTLGSGNHFISLEKSDVTGDVWLVIHSGSRNFGKCVCEYHEYVARTELLNKRETLLKEKVDAILSDNSNLTDRPRLLKEAKESLGLSWNIDIKGVEFLEDEFAVNYLTDMIFTQEYANFNRVNMAKSILGYFNLNYSDLENIHTKHNFIDFDDWVIRKGAIRSYENEKIIIPFNMQEGSLICVGKSNKDWNCSAPHGAGRLFSRTKAKATLSMDDYIKAMEGIFTTCVRQGTLDEAPGAYKDPRMIEDAISETATLLERIKPIYNLKG